MCSLWDKVEINYRSRQVTNDTPTVCNTYCFPLLQWLLNTPQCYIYTNITCLVNHCKLHLLIHTDVEILHAKTWWGDRRDQKKTFSVRAYSFHWSSLCINCIWIWNMSINIRQHKTHRKIHSQDKTIKQNKHIYSSKPKYCSSNCKPDRCSCSATDHQNESDWVGK